METPTGKREGIHTTSPPSLPSNRNNINNPSINLLLLQHIADSKFAQQSRSRKVKRHDTVPKLHIQIADRIEVVHDPGVVDQDVDLAECADEFFEESFYFASVGDICLDGLQGALG